MGEVHYLTSPEAGRGRATAAREPVGATIRAAGGTPIDLTGSSAADSAEAAAQARKSVGRSPAVARALEGAGGKPAADAFLDSVHR